MSSTPPPRDLERHDPAAPPTRDLAGLALAAERSRRPRPRHAAHAPSPSGQSPEHRSSSSSTCKDFLRKFVDNELLTASLEDWFAGNSEDCGFRKPAFDVPFDLTELQNFDYALEGVTFQQLVRMPNALHASTSDVFEATAHLALEDFLHAGIKGLWEAFWGPEEAMPFSVACIHSTSSRFYPAEKAISSGKLDGVCATAVLLKNSKHSQGRWDHIIVLALLRPDVGMVSAQNDQHPSPAVLGEALFFALRVLLSRSLSRSSTVLRNADSVYVLLVDSQFGGVVNVQGDLNKLSFDTNNVYECAAEWIKNDAKITVSSVDRVWNKLGNANWGDIGTLQVLLAVFHSMIQFCGAPKYSLDELATEHSSRLQSRRSERHLVDRQSNGNGLYRFQQRSHSPEIVEVQEEGTVDVKPEEILKLEIGSIVLMEDSNCQKGFQINDIRTESEPPIYGAIPVEEPTKSYLLYVGSSPSHLEPAWEDMNSWYQVQRQTKVLTLMKQRDISSRYIPQMIASGRVVHPGPCNKPNSSGSCGHPLCSTPILVTSPVGETISNLIRNGLFGVEDALRCCHDCFSALAAASSAGIRHGDIRPENVIRVSNGSRNPHFVLIGWGHAILEDRDQPSMNLFFSSTFALQEGKLCAASDAESLIYLLYFSCGGVCPELDSVEGALQWRETSWSRRVIQQKLGDVAAVLKAFADYVDSLCGTPYPMDYEIWLRRFRRTINEDHGLPLPHHRACAAHTTPLSLSLSLSLSLPDGRRYPSQASKQQRSSDSTRMEMLFSSLFCDSASSDNFSGHPDVERCPFLRNINGATTFSFSSALPVAARGGKGPIFEEGPGFESAFKLFHGQDGIVPLSGRSYVHDENRSESTDVKPEPALPFNPLAARAATISLSAFGPFGFNFFIGKGKKQNKKPNNLDQSQKKPNKSNQNSMKQKGGNPPPSHESLSDEWLENGQCPLARSYRAMSGVLPLVAKALQPPAGMKLKCPPAIVAARAALARTTLVKSLRPQPLPAKMVAIALLGMAANVPLGVWREHTKKFSPQWFAAVHAAVPFIAMLRKSVNMPRTAMVFTIAASILGQTIGSRAERIRMKTLAAKSTAGAAATNAAMYPNRNGNCSDTEGKPWDPLTLKMSGSVSAGASGPTPSMCF